MYEPVEVYGNEESIDGVIVGFNPENSGFIYEGDFREQNIDDIGYTLVIEVAEIESDQLVYFPVNNNKLTVTESDVDSTEDSLVPIVKNSDGIETRTVVIQHPVLESANIKMVEKLREEAFECLDTKYPVHILWQELRGREISCSGVKMNNMVIADSASVKERKEVNIGDVEIVKDAEELMENKYIQKMNDGRINCYQLLKVDETIMTISYHVNAVQLGSDYAMEGILELTDNGFRIADAEIKKKREEYEPY